mmetsp:Transcript_12856/g.34619  ORF Transcript_12856/g.34619 Transcript_12856/m.34619 type:complete len:219 (+) Transcript_12856:56-712(+)
MARKRATRRSAAAGIDGWASEALYSWYQETGLGRAPLMMFEFSGHGVPWLLFSAGTFAFLEGSEKDSAYCSAALHLFVGLLTDLLFILAIKPVVRRRRPKYDTGKQLGSVHSVDQYSFPSGHATRAFFIAVFSTIASDRLGVGSTTLSTALLIWATAMCVSRICLGRHYIGDVLAGVVIGCLNAGIIALLWQPTAKVDAFRSDLMRAGLDVLSRVNKS